MIGFNDVTAKLHKEIDMLKSAAMAWGDSKGQIKRQIDIINGEIRKLREKFHRIEYD